MGWSALEERVTHHGKGGKFCSPGSAMTVTKDGERYKVVRQHRRIKPRISAESEEMRTRGALALARASMRGWTSVSDLFEGTLSYRVEGVSRDGVTLSVVFPTKPVKFPVIDYRGSKWSALAGTLGNDGKYFADYRKVGSLSLGAMGRL